MTTVAGGSAMRGVGGAHLQGGQGCLARKDLDPFDADRLEAGLLGRQDADGVGAGLGVVLVQGQAGGRGVDLDVGGGAVRPGHPADGKTVPCDGDADPCHGGGLPGGVATGCVKIPAAIAVMLLCFGL